MTALSRGRGCIPILVVEDDSDIREALCEILAEQGYSVRSAANGREALEQLETIGHPCLILLDLMMPVMDGPTFLRALRADDRIAPIPVVVVTAWPRDVSVASSVQGVVKKPVDIDLLLRLVERYCGQTHGTGGG